MGRWPVRTPTTSASSAHSKRNSTSPRVAFYFLVLEVPPAPPPLGWRDTEPRSQSARGASDKLTTLPVPSVAKPFHASRSARNRSTRLSTPPPSACTPIPRFLLSPPTS